MIAMKVLKYVLMTNRITNYKYIFVYDDLKKAVTSSNNVSTLRALPLFREKWNRAGSLSE